MFRVHRGTTVLPLVWKVIAGSLHLCRQIRAGDLESEVRSSLIRRQTLYTAGFPLMWELFMCSFRAAVGAGAALRGQQPPHRAHRFPWEEKEQSCCSICSPSQIPLLSLAEVPCPNLAPMATPQFW